VITMGGNIVLSLVFAAWFEKIGWMPHGGLALANSLATGLESIVLVILIRRKLNGLEGAYVWKGLGISAVGTALMAAAVIGVRGLLGGRALVVELFGALLAGMVVYVGLMWALKMPELRGMVGTLVSRIRKS
jgi:putative peptidoglycan lipid II flippase